MKQKQLWSVFLLTLTLELLVACGTAPSTTPAESVNDEVEPTAAPEPTVEPTTAHERVKVRWVNFLGQGALELQAVADEFNGSQDRLELVIEAHKEEIAPLILGDNAADIVGPLDIANRDAFKGAWLDLQPLIDASRYDLSDFDLPMVEILMDKEAGQLGIPFGVLPSVIFVNKDTFDAADIPYPPQEYGAPYIDENGQEKPWNLDTLREVAMKLTIDKNGSNATSPSFDAENIVQFGYYEEFADMRGALTLFGPGSFVADDGKTAQLPEHWRTGAQWVYDAMWKDHFWPTGTYVDSILLEPGDDLSGAFQSGKLAMAHGFSWFAAAPLLGPDAVDFTWNMAAVPAYGDKPTARLRPLTFYVPKGSSNPEAAFEILTYLSSPEITLKVLKAYPMIPARLSLQDEYVMTYSQKEFPGQDINWQVVLDSARYADIPNHDRSWIPDACEGYGAYNGTWTRMRWESGLDINEEMDKLLEALDKLFAAEDCL